MEPTTLADIRDSRPVRVTQLHPGHVEAEHLAELGFLPGTTVVKVGEAPFGDPIVYAIRGTRFALRRNHAQQVGVEPA